MFFPGPHAGRHMSLFELKAGNEAVKDKAKKGVWRLVAIPNLTARWETKRGYGSVIQ